MAMAFVRYDVPDAAASEVVAAGRFVDECVDAMPDVTRVGVKAAAGLAWLALSVLGGAPYQRQSWSARSTNALRLSRVRLPVLSELTRLSRGLGLVGVVEQRSRAGPPR